MKTLIEYETIYTMKNIKDSHSLDNRSMDLEEYVKIYYTRTYDNNLSFIGYVANGVGHV